MPTNLFHVIYCVFWLSKRRSWYTRAQPRDILLSGVWSGHCAASALAALLPLLGSRCSALSLSSESDTLSGRDAAPAAAPTPIHQTATRTGRTMQATKDHAILGGGHPTPCTCSAPQSTPNGPSPDHAYGAHAPAEAGRVTALLRRGPLPRAASVALYRPTSISSANSSSANSPSANLSRPRRAIARSS